MPPKQVQLLIARMLLSCELTVVPKMRLVVPKMRLLVERKLTPVPGKVTAVPLK